MKKKILFVSDWSDQKGNVIALQTLLDKNYSNNYEWKVWSCKKNEGIKFLHRWKSYFKGVIYIIKNRNKYDAIFIWQQMVGYFLFEITRIVPFKIKNVVIYTFFNYKSSSTSKNNYRKDIIKNTLKKSKALIWPSILMADDAKNDFPEFKHKIHYTINPIMDIIKDDVHVINELDDPYFRNGVYAAGGSERDHNIVIKAFRNTDIPVTIVCKDDYIFTETNITPNIRILRFSQVNSEQYYALARQAFCILNSVTHEKSPCGQLLVAFAMNNSIPAISTDCYGVKDYLVNNVNGILFNVGKSDDIRKAYEKLKSDKEFTAQLITNAKIKIKEMNPDNFIEKIIEIIED